MEHRSRGVQRLQFVLNVESGEDIFGITYGQVRTVGVIRRFALGRGGDDIGEILDVVLSHSVSRGLGGSCLEIVKIAVQFLIVGESVAHVNEYLFGKFLRFAMS